MNGKRSDYPIFRKAQVEHVPFYKGPPIEAAQRTPSFTIMVAVGVAIGVLIGIAIL